MVRRTAVLHVLSGPARERAHAQEQLAHTGATRSYAVQGARGSGRGPELAVVPQLAAAGAGAAVRLLHCHGLDGAWSTWRASLGLACRWGLSVQGSDVLLSDDLRLRKAMQAARMVVVPSQFMAEAVLARRVKHARVLVVPPGVPLGHEPVERPPGPEPVVVFTGPFTEQSGVLDVAAVLAEAPVRARFVGSGPLLAALRGTGADVTETDDPAVQRAALDAADLAMCGGRSTEDGDAEAWGRTAVEAQAAGRPVIAPRNGGLTEWVAPEGAVLVPAHGNVRRSLADALGSLLARPEQWAALGRAGRAHVRDRLDVRQQTAELESLWTALHRRQPLAGALLRPPDQF